MLVRTVTRARAQLNTVHGHGINGGLANIRVGAVDHSGVHRARTASRMSRPAKSMAVARSQARSIPAFSAAIMANTTLPTRPPAKKWASPIGGDVDARFFGSDPIDHNDSWIDFPEAHHDEVEQT